MDKEDVVYIHTHNGILLNNNKKKIMSLAATWMDLEIIILNEVRKIYQGYHFMWNIKHGSNEPINKRETDSQT